MNDELKEIRERHESDDAILLGHIEAECCDAHRESHNDRAELLRIVEEQEKQLEANTILYKNLVKRYESLEEVGDVTTK
jgi:hypothetical protein